MLDHAAYGLAGCSPHSDCAAEDGGSRRNEGQREDLLMRGSHAVCAVLCLAYGFAALPAEFGPSLQGRTTLRTN